MRRGEGSRGSIPYGDFAAGLCSRGSIPDGDSAAGLYSHAPSGLWRNRTYVSPNGAAHYSQGIYPLVIPCTTHSLSPNGAAHHSQGIYPLGINGAFSVNPGDYRAAVQYIANQEEHHRTRTFQEEFLLFLKKYHVSYDENHLWDEP